MLAPQSREEIQRYVDELQSIDRLLDIRWNPEARIVNYGSYTELGKATYPEYDGRWEVIRYDSAEHGHAGLHPGRGYTVIVEICEYGEEDGILFIYNGSDYAPVDARIVTLMRSADGHNTRQAMALREKLWRQHDAAEAAAGAIDEAKAIAGIDHAHFTVNYAGGVGNWQGKGADFGAMERAAAARTSAAVTNILKKSHH